ncbi:DMT family transporter [Variovorax sp. PCZ-1]|uniref:DMT family transporter n=1 Tax=Variovorax sp. PCZ-1 TaxID=2835533 RepID=UPI001BCF35D4|nr:DMT family transporter [Variovorax sp. PCZ-1]MBS7806647.1 EamA family transporter [Variovorax sp. PCZ-1]
MPLAALFLVLLGALIHALWNVAAKKAGGDARFTFFSCVIMFIVWSPLCIWLGWDMLPAWGWKEWTAMAVSGFVHWLYFICLLTGYRKSDLTVVYPVARGSGPLLSSGVAVIVFGEQLSAFGVLGIAGVVIGVFLVAGGPALFRAAHDPSKRARIQAGIFWGVLTGALIACYTILDAWAVKMLAISPILFDYWCNVLRMPYSSIAVLRDIPEARRLWKLQWKYAAIVAIFSPIAYVLVLYAMKIAPVSHVAPAREVSMLFAALIGGQLLGESDRGLRILGACAIAAGVMALALG